MTTIQLPKLSESELKFAQELVSKALINHNKEDISESLNILKKYYDKSNPILDINGFIPNCGSWTPLAVAAYFNNYRAINSLIALGAEVNFAHDEMSYPLQLAAAKGYEVSVMYLIKAGADINLRDKSGKSALMRVAERSDTKKTMLDHFLNESINKQKLDMSIWQESLDIAKDKSPEISKALSYWKLQKTLVPKGTSERRTKI